MWGHAKNGYGGLVKKNNKFVLIKINQSICSNTLTYDLDLPEKIFDNGEYQDEQFIYVNHYGMNKIWFKKACQLY